MAVQLLVALDGSAEVSAAELAQAWAADEAAYELGSPSVAARGQEQFFPGLVELVVVPLLVNVASDVVTGLVRRLVARVRHDRGEPELELELVETVGTDGRRVVIARARRVSS